MLFIGLLFLYYRFCLGMTSAAGNEIAKAKLPAEVTIAEFLSWTSGKFYNYFPKKRERYPISLGLYTCRYKIHEADDLTCVTIETKLASHFPIVNQFGFRNYTLTANIEITEEQGGLLVKLLEVEAIAIGWLKKYFVGVIRTWPNTQLISGHWILSERTSNRQETAGKLDTSDSTDESNDWSREPDSNNRYDWFRHRLWCENNNVRPQTHKYMGKKCNLSESRFQHEYLDWKAEQE